jgi:hypothetical protein
MAYLDFYKLQSFNAVGAGQRATLNVPTTAIYHQTPLTYKRNGVLATEAQMKSDLKMIRLLLNGRVQREFTATELFTENAFRDLPVSDGIVPIWLTRPWARAAEGEDALAWGTRNIETFQIEVEIDAAAVSPSLEAHALVENAPNRDIGAIEKWHRYNVPVSAIGVASWNPNIEPLSSYCGLTCYSTDIDGVKVVVDNTNKFEGDLEQINALYEHAELVPQANAVHLAWDYRGRLSDSLPMAFSNGYKVRNFRVDFTMGAANSFSVTARRLGLPD